jgi:hypothetical protein
MNNGPFNATLKAAGLNRDNYNNIKLTNIEQLLDFDATVIKKSWRTLVHPSNLDNLIRCGMAFEDSKYLDYTQFEDCNN